MPQKNSKETTCLFTIGTVEVCASFLTKCFLYGAVIGVATALAYYISN